VFYYICRAACAVHLSHAGNPRLVPGKQAPLSGMIHHDTGRQRFLYTTVGRLVPVPVLLREAQGARKEQL